MPRARRKERARPNLSQGPADLQLAALTTELCTHSDIIVTVRLPVLLRDAARSVAQSASGAADAGVRAHTLPSASQRRAAAASAAAVAPARRVIQGHAELETPRQLLPGHLSQKLAKHIYSA